VSLVILDYNRGRKSGVADGIVITPSHNPPHDGGFKYNPPSGGPAASAATAWIGAKANLFLENGLLGLQRMPFEKALRAPTAHRHDYLKAYITDLANVLDMDAIRSVKLRMGVDPLGGAGVHYWGRIAERYGLNLTVVNEAIDPTFLFMAVDWGGQIRMDPSSPYEMRRLIGMKDRFDLAFACDTDHDRHGIVTRNAGLLPPNHYLSVAIFFLLQHQPKWRKDVAVGKTVVSSQMIDRVTTKLGRKLYEVPVGFKWIVDGLFDGSLGFAGEESVGATLVRLDGTVWTTDKDGIVSALLAAEITARMGRDPGGIYRELTDEFGEPAYGRIEARATPEQKARLAKLSPRQVKLAELASEKIQTVLTRAPGNGEPIGGLKVITESDGLGPATVNVNGIKRRFFDYVGCVVPYGPDDGTLAPWAVVASLPFAPDIVLPAIEYFINQIKLTEFNSYGFKATLNPTYPVSSKTPFCWVSKWHYGLNQGPIVLMIENYRTGLVWRFMRDCTYIVNGLRRAGFGGGWL